MKALKIMSKKVKRLTLFTQITCYFSTKQKAIIISGGPGGLISALTLAKNGIECHIYEKQPELANNVGGAIAIHGGLRCIDYLGFGDEFRQISSKIGVGYFNDINGNTIATTNQFGFLKNDVNRWPRNVQRSKFLHLLKNLCNNSSNITFNFNTKYIKYETNKNEVKAYFDDNTNNTADMLIGFDGMQSVIRKQILSEYNINDNDICKYTNISGWYCIGNLLNEELNELGNDSQVIIDLFDNTFGMLLRLPSSKEYTLYIGYYDNHRNKNGWNLNVNKEMMLEFVNKLDNKYNKYSELINKSERVMHLCLHTVNMSNTRLNKWHHGRVIILGDACHTLPPFGGQGTNNAIYDAITLGYLCNKYNNNIKDYNVCQNIFNDLYEIRHKGINDALNNANKIKNVFLQPKNKHWIRNNLVKFAVKSGLIDRTVNQVLQPVIGFDIY